MRQTLPRLRKGITQTRSEICVVYGLWQRMEKDGAIMPKTQRLLYYCFLSWRRRIVIKDDTLYWKQQGGYLLILENDFFSTDKFAAQYYNRDLKK